MDNIAHVLPGGKSIILPAYRRFLANRFGENLWWERTDDALLAELLTLPADWDGALDDLADGKRNEFGGVEVLRLLKVLRNDFMAVFEFQVRNPVGTEYKYSYVTLSQGDYPGVRGIVFVRDGGSFTGFILVFGERLATGKAHFGSAGGFIDNPVQARLLKPNDLPEDLHEQVIRELREELNAPLLKVERIEMLGRMAVDPGLTNARPGLFYAVITAAEAAKLTSEEAACDPRDPATAPHIFAIPQLGPMLRQVDESFFLAIIAPLAGRAIFEGRLYPAQLLPLVLWSTASAARVVRLGRHIRLAPKIQMR